MVFSNSVVLVGSKEIFALTIISTVLVIPIHQEYLCSQDSLYMCT